MPCSKNGGGAAQFSQFPLSKSQNWDWEKLGKIGKNWEKTWEKLGEKSQNWDWEKLGKTGKIGKNWENWEKLGKTGKNWEN